MISREDILAELELLPVWQVRGQTLKPVSTVAMPGLAFKKEKEGITQTAEPVRNVENIIEPKQHSFRLIVSEDSAWLFVLTQQHSNEAEMLLLNMLKAVAVKVGQDIADESDVHLGQYASKVIVVMGESEAQQFLSENVTLTQLRGRVHHYQGHNVIATYSPSELLDNLSNKAEAWKDLCLAKFTIANL